MVDVLGACQIPEGLFFAAGSVQEWTSKDAERFAVQFPGHMIARLFVETPAFRKGALENLLQLTDKEFPHKSLITMIISRVTKKHPKVEVRNDDARKG